MYLHFMHVHYTESLSQTDAKGMDYRLGISTERIVDDSIL